MSEKTKIMTVMAAVFAVAMMLAVPVFAAVDTDADFTGDEAGFTIIYDNPTPAQLPFGTNKALQLYSILGGYIE